MRFEPEASSNKVICGVHCTIMKGPNGYTVWHHGHMIGFGETRQEAIDKAENQIVKGRTVYAD